MARTIEYKFPVSVSPAGRARTTETLEKFDIKTTSFMKEDRNYIKFDIPESYSDESVMSLGMLIASKMLS
jgi:hypothetical protein